MLSNGQAIPPEFAPRPNAAPGIDNAWTATSLNDGLPVAPKSTFHPYDEVCLSILYVELRPEQNVVVRMWNEGTPSNVHETKLRSLMGSGYTGVTWRNATRGMEIGRYNVQVTVDGLPAKQLSFQISL